jgi:hypothetical protein
MVKLFATWRRAAGERIRAGLPAGRDGVVTAAASRGCRGYCGRVIGYQISLMKPWASTATDCLPATALPLTHDQS